MEPLITDRTRADADFAFLNQHLPDLKGAYNASDLNRVSEWVNFWAYTLRRLGYAVNVEEMKTDWMDEDIPNEIDFHIYLDGVRALRAAFVVLAETPAIPENINELSGFQGWIKANNIEQNLIDIEFLIQNMIHTIDLGWALGIAHIGIWGIV